MPHVIIKMLAGRTAEQKSQLAAAITQSVTSIAGCEDEAVSIAIEDFAPEDWAEKVYRPDIMEKGATLVKKPGYNPFEP
jgi:4-oxalocrotonate tautomerase